jgi:DNA-directed RNA polymerase specialized sigma24 family protein
VESSIGSVTVWVKQLPAGDLAAQEAIFRRYQEPLVAYAAFRLKQLGVRATEADDIAQEVFMGLFRRTVDGKMPDLIDRDDLWLKLRRICGDRVKDARRKRTLNTESALGDGVDVSVVGLARVAEQHFDDCVLTLEHGLLQHYLRQRSPDLPEIASLRMQGYSIDQIAEKLQLPPRTVDRRVQWINELCDEYQKL